MRPLSAVLVSVALAFAVPSAATSQPIGAPDSPGTTGPHDSAPAAPHAVASDTTLQRRFDIPAQPLSRALDDFHRQSGVLVRVEGVVDSTVRAHAVVGAFTAAQAIRVLLAGTGYEARFPDEQSVVVRVPGGGGQVAQALDRVVITGEARGRSGYAGQRTATATKTDVPLRDVPQAVTVVNRELLADQSMQSMAEVVRYMPGITMGQGEGHRDAPTIRGNSSTADFFVDGVRDDAQYLRDVYNVERVEALKGANAMIFGRGGGGGVLNRVTKEAQWSRTRALTFEGGSFDHRRATLDLGQGFGPSVAARVNGLYENSGVFRNEVELERQGVNPTAAILAGGTLVRLGYEYFADRRTVDRGIPSFQGRPSDTDITTFFGNPDVNRSRAVVNAATATIERGLGGGAMLRNRTRVADYDKFYANVVPGAVDSTGTTVNLSAYSNAMDRRNLFNQTDVTYAFATGTVRQTLLVGADVGRQRTDSYRSTGYFNDTAATLVAPLSDPTIDTPVSFRQSATDADNRTTANVAGVYAQDQVELGEHWEAIVGLRYERFDVRYHNNRTNESLGRTDNMLSPRAGLLFKPVEAMSLYGTYSVSYLPSSGDQFSSLTATTETLEPERFLNREIGLKWDVRPDFALTGAVYRLDRTNTSAPDPVDATRVVQTGRQRTTGYEVGLTGNVTGAWQIAGGYASQRATIVSRTAAAAAGATVPLVPHHTLSLWNRYQFARFLGAGLGVVRQADMYAAVDNKVTIPGFTRVDAALYANVSQGVRVQLNLENLLDKRYYATSHGNNNILPGASRAVRVSITATP